jgi:hypothetical protein
MMRFSCLLYALSIGTFSLYAQDAAAASNGRPPELDVLIFNDGEKLIGHLERAVGTTVFFKSDMAGEVKVDSSKIKELRTAGKFAVVGKVVTLRKHLDTASIPHGTLTIANDEVKVTPDNRAKVQTLPLTGTGFIVDENTFTKNVLTLPGFFEGWKGAATAGVSLVLATQKNRTVTSAINLVRTVPGESWMQTENRTSINFNSAYGALSQPNSPTIKTSLYHADFERDQYFSPRLYYFGSGAWDHNISQGLDLQQTYGGGIGWTVINNTAEQLDIRASVDYINQMFNPALEALATGTTPVVEQSPYGMSLIGSVFSETYNRKLPRSIVLTQFLTITPSWNNLEAYSANDGLNLTLPLYRRLGITIGAIDTFLNDPPSGFKKNSFQFTAGVTYTVP